MAVKERELQRLKAELEAIDSDRARTEEEKKKMRAAFEEKVEAVQRHMVQLQKQLKEGEAAKVGHQGCSQGLYLLHVILSICSSLIAITVVVLERKMRTMTMPIITVMMMMMIMVMM